MGDIKNFYGSSKMREMLGYLKTELISLLSGKANTSDLGTAASRNATNQITEGSTALPEAGAVKTALDGQDKRISELEKRDKIRQIIYGFHIDMTEDDADAKVTYLDDAVGMTPAYMDFTSGKFNYGSWDIDSIFFYPKPCMLGFDGKVLYYLDRDDQSKKADGTAADTDFSFPGNAMKEYGRDGQLIWWMLKMDSDGNGLTFRVANYRVSEEFQAYNHRDANDDYIPHFYTPIYPGSVDSNNRLRSLSDKDYTNRCRNLDRATEWAYAMANDIDPLKPMHTTETFCDWVLETMLAILIVKSTDAQAKYGEGRTGFTWTESNLATTGILNNKGMMYGESSSTGLGVKILYREQAFGDQWQAIAGLFNDNGIPKTKMTRGKADGSSATNYNTTGSGYNTLANVSLPSVSGNYISKLFVDTKYGIIPTEASANADNKGFNDGLWTNNGQVNYAFRGGNLSNGRLCGLFCLRLAHAAGVRYWDVGAALSCKPLAEVFEE